MTKLEEIIGDKIAVIRNKKEASIAEIQSKYDIKIRQYLDKIESYRFQVKNETINKKIKENKVLNIISKIIKTIIYIILIGLLFGILVQKYQEMTSHWVA